MNDWRSDLLVPYAKLLPKIVHASTDPLDDPKFWRAVVLKLGTMPMPCPYAIRSISAEYGVDPERAFARFWTHYCHDAPGLQ
jgi:hypothetical protein